MKSLIYWQ